LAAGYYILAGVVAKDFWYDGLDLMFSGGICLCLVIYFLFNQKKLFNRVWFWVVFFATVALKLMSVPLALIYFLGRKLSFKKEVIGAGLGGLVVWGLPLVYFRSSLSVIAVYNLGRSFKYASFPYFIVESINAFTKSEFKIDMPPDFSLEGPFSTMIENAFNILLPVAFLGLVFYMAKKLKEKNIDLFFVNYKMTFLYVFTFFIFSKIYSQPFPIWTVPLIAIFPYRDVKKLVLMMGLSLILLVIDTTNYWNLGVYGLEPLFGGPLTIGFLRSLLKFGVIGALLITSFSMRTKKAVR